MSISTKCQLAEKYTVPLVIHKWYYLKGTVSDNTVAAMVVSWEAVQLESEEVTELPGISICIQNFL